jgi:hypothetical protein
VGKGEKGFDLSVLQLACHGLGHDCRHGPLQGEVAAHAIVHDALFANPDGACACGRIVGPIPRVTQNRRFASFICRRPSNTVDNDNQTFVPESFIALYRDARNRLTAPRETIAARYELCEDMANLLTEQCSTIHFRDGVDEEQILQRCWKGLRVEPLTVEPPEAEWVVRRTAELLQWPWDFSAD